LTHGYTYLSPYLDGNLYSALSAVAGQPGSIRRTYGSKKQLKSERLSSITSSEDYVLKAEGTH